MTKKRWKGRKPFLSVIWCKRSDIGHTNDNPLRKLLGSVKERKIKEIDTKSSILSLNGDNF